MIDRGSGPAVVLIPGVQGRWEWMEPTVRALSLRCRVVSYSLCDEPASGFATNGQMGFERYLDQLAKVLERANLGAPVLVGVSYGGLIAAEFAARWPGRVSGLVLASALPMDWRPDARARFYLRAPWLLSPLFCLTSPLRLSPEIRAAVPGLGARLRFSASHGLRVLRAMLHPGRMAERVRLLDDYTFADPAAISAPTLLLTGEPGLDRVVPVQATRRYLDLIPHARHEVLPRTGHIGLVTRPNAFAERVARFASEVTGPRTTRRDDDIRHSA